MKKLFILFSFMALASMTFAQSLDEIINRSYAATGAEKLEKAKTLYIEGKASQMGIEMPMTMYMKQPDKVKIVITYNGMDIVTMFDGEKGYMINPLAGSTEPIELPKEQLSDIQKNNMFHNQLMDNFRSGKITLMGTEEVNGKPAFKLMISVENGSPQYYYIDKESFLTVKTTATVAQMGQEMEVESYIREYSDINGIKFPKLTVSFVNGTEAGSMSMDKIEIDKEIDDAIFSVK